MHMHIHNIYKYIYIYTHYVAHVHDINISLLMIKPAYCNSLFFSKVFFLTMIWNQSVRSRIPIVGLVLGFKRSWQNLAEGVCSHSGGVHPNPLGFAKFGNFTNFSKYSPNILPNSGECWNIFWFLDHQKHLDIPVSPLHFTRCISQNSMGCRRTAAV